MQYIVHNTCMCACTGKAERCYNQSCRDVKINIIEYGSTLYVGLQLKQNGRPYKAMVRTVSKSRKETFSKLQKVSSLHYHAFL